MPLRQSDRVVTSLVLMAGAISFHAPARAESPSASVRILYAGQPLPVVADDRKPYQDLSDNAICVAPESLERLGFSYTTGARGDVMLSVPDHDTVVRAAPRAALRGRGQFINVVEAMDSLGGRCQWDSGTNTLYIRPVLSGVRFDGDKLIVSGSLPLRAPSVKKTDDKTKIYFDFDGVDVGTLSQKTLGPVEGNVNGAKAIQVGRTARLVVSLNRPATYAAALSDTPTNLALAPAIARPRPLVAQVLPGRIAAKPRPAPAPVRRPAPVPVQVAIARPAPVDIETVRPEPDPAPDERIVATVVPSDPKPAPRPASKAASRPVRTAFASRSARPGFRSAPPPSMAYPGGPAITGLRFNADSPDRARLFLTGNRDNFPMRVTNQGGRLVLDIPSAALGGALTDGSLAAGFHHPLVSGVHVAAAANGGARLTLDTTRPVNFQLRLNQDGGGTLLDITPQADGDLPLKGRTIIVDPGHGGKDRGAPGVNGTQEANNTLAISRIVVEELRALGADVTLNRDCDMFVGLEERAYIANRQQADFFVAIHCDSAGSSAQGSTAYYHLDDPIDRGLAQCIANRLTTIGDIGTRGAKSDGRIYSTGFAVLRHSQMTGVLVETGYMSNWHDAEALASEETRRKIAQAVAGGVADFVKLNPALDTKYAKPGTGGSLYVAPDDPR